MFLLKWLLSVKNIRHLKNLLKIRYLPFASVNMTIRLSRERPNWFLGQPQGRAPSSGRACSQAHSSFSSPEPVVSWSRGLVGYKLSRVALGTRMVKAFFFALFQCSNFFCKKNLLQNFLQTSMYIMLLESESVRICAARFPARTYSREEGRVATPDCVTLAWLQPERLRRRLLTLEANGKTGPSSRRRNRAAIPIASHRKSVSSTRNFQTSYDY